VPAACEIRWQVVDRQLDGGAQCHGKASARPAGALVPAVSDRSAREVPAGKAAFYEAPVFNPYEGYLSVLYSRLHIGSAQRFPMRGG